MCVSENKAKLDIQNKTLKVHQKKKKKNKTLKLIDKYLH